MAIFVGTLTLIISITGIVLALRHFFFYREADSELAKRLRLVFLADAGIYAITAAFGVWAFFEWPFSIALGMQWVRIPILLLGIYASVKLYQHYREYN